MRRQEGRPRSRSRRAILTLVLLGVGLSGRARAQGNAFGAPIGGRTALMGGTGIALAVDGAAPFLNPATIVRMDDQRFAFSVNFYNYSVTHFSNWHQPGPVDASQFGDVALANTAITSSGFSGLPSTLCIFFTTAEGAAASTSGDPTLHPGRQKLSLCLASLESLGVGFGALPFDAGTSLGQTAQSQSFLQSWNRLYVGPSYSVSFGQRLALGLSLHGVVTTDSYTLDSNAITTSVAGGGVQSSFGAAGGGTSYDMSATLGGIYRAGAYTTGLSLALPALHIAGSYAGTMHSAFGSGTAASATISNGTGSFSAAPPVRVGLGVGAEWPGLTVEADASVDIPAPSGFTAGLAGNTTTLASGVLSSTTFLSSFNVQQHVVVNAGVGAEYFFKPTLSVVGGASLNLTAEPPLSPTLTVGNIVQQRRSTAIVSGGVGSYGPSGNVLLGLQFGYGWGESLAANPYVTPNQWAVVDLASYNVLVILAGSTSLRSLGRAVERIEHVIVGNPVDPDVTPGGAGAPGGPARQAPRAAPAP